MSTFKAYREIAEETERAKALLALDWPGLDFDTVDSFEIRFDRERGLSTEVTRRPL